jgi:hypothetical protein
MYIWVIGVYKDFGAGIYIMNLKCLFGFHEYEKFMGVHKTGSQYKQNYKCLRCGKLIEKLT